MTATLGAVTVPITPVIDQDALNASLRESVASALRTLADELDPPAEPVPTTAAARYYVVSDRDADFWVLDREDRTRRELLEWSGIGNAAREDALAYASRLNTGTEELPLGGLDPNDYAPLTEVTE